MDIYKRRIAEIAKIVQCDPGPLKAIVDQFDIPAYRVINDEEQVAREITAYLDGLARNP